MDGDPLAWQARGAGPSARRLPVTHTIMYPRFHALLVKDWCSAVRRSFVSTLTAVPLRGPGARMCTTATNLEPQIQTIRECELSPRTQTK